MLGDIRIREGSDVCEVDRPALSAELHVQRLLAASLGVSPQAFAKRLRIAEERPDRPLASCALELDAALRLDELTFRWSNESQPVAPV